MLGHVLCNPGSCCCKLGMAKAVFNENFTFECCFNLFFLKVTEKTARYQQKLEEKQADSLRIIKEKESQVKAKLMLMVSAVSTANPKH